MEETFWLQRWEKNDIGFHKLKPHHYLSRFFDQLHLRAGDTVFVPLCGKSPDLVWLREQGLHVVGVELSRVAVEAFVSENNLAAEWQAVADLSCCHSEGYTLYCGDLFELKTENLKATSALYDRGSLVALPPKMRRRYANHIASLLPSGGRMLLISYDYDQIETYGPPFSVPRSEIGTLFRKDFDIELLIEEDTLWSHQGLAARGVTKLSEFAVLLTRR